MPLPCHPHLHHVVTAPEMRNVSLGKKSAPKRVHPTLTLLSFARKKKKRKRGERDSAQFGQKTKKNKGRQTLRSRASWSELGLAQLCHHWHCLLYRYRHHPSILTQSLSSFYKSSYGYSIYPHHYDNISQDFPRQSEITKWIEKGGWPTRMYPLTGLHKL